MSAPGTHNEANPPSVIDDDIEADDTFEEEDEAPGDPSEDANDEESPSPPLTRDEVEYAFRRATSGFAGGKDRWAERAATGLTDEELAGALKYEIGSFGGQGGPGMLGISYQGNGLKIWADRGIGSCRRKPVFAGASTVAMARTVYGIKDPADKQMSLL
jgi:hypothetical protein